MYINNLPKVKVDALGKAFRKERHWRTRLRYQAVWLLARGYKRKEVGSIVGVSKDRIRQWVTMYHKGGLDGLKYKAIPGNHHTLSVKQKKTIKKLLNKYSPDELKLKEINGRFWNIPLLKKLVRIKFNLEYKNDDSYRRLFHFSGLTFHKPTKVNKNQKEHMRKRFEEKLKKDSGGTREKIVWYW